MAGAEKIEHHLVDTIQKHLDDPAIIRKALKRAKKEIKQLPRHRSATHQLKVNAAMQQMMSDIFHRVMVFLDGDDQTQLARQLLRLEIKEKTHNQKASYFNHDFKRIMTALAEGRLADWRTDLRDHVNWRKEFRAKDELEVRPHPTFSRGR